jgi:hypothetical protein
MLPSSWAWRSVTAPQLAYFEQSTIWLMLVNPVLANGMDAKGVEASGVEANGIDASGVDASGMLASGMDANGVEASGVEASGIEASGVEASGIEASGVDANGMEARGTDLTSSSNTVDCAVTPSCAQVRPVLAISAHHAAKLSAVGGFVGIGMLANGMEPNAMDASAIEASGELDRSRSRSVILATFGATLGVLKVLSSPRVG